MATLYENQLREPQGPLASFFQSIDIEKRGFLELPDLQSFVFGTSDTLSLSFMQKRWILLCLTQFHSKINSHDHGQITLSDLSYYATRLLGFFCGRAAQSPQECLLLSQKNFQTISANKLPITFSRLRMHLIDKMPILTPHKKVLAHILTQSLFLFCSQMTHESISEKRWTDTALALYFELYNQS